MFVMPSANLILALLALLLAVSLAGCVTPPSPHSEVEEIAVRTDAVNQVVERLTKKHSYWSYVKLLTPNGVEHYSFAVRNHYFLNDEQGKRTALKFLDQRDGVARVHPVWFTFKPVDGTNCWVRVERLYDRGGDDPKARTLFVSVFNSERMLHQRRIETSEYISDYHHDEHLKFGPGNRTVTWHTEKDNFSYDVLNDTLIDKKSAQAPK